MLVDFKIDPKAQCALIKFNPQNISSDKDTKDLLSLMTIVCADFYLDPELELEQLEEIITKGKEENKQIEILIDEEGIELEFISA